MGTHQQTVVEIASAADVNALVDRMPELRDGSVVVSVHDDSSSMLTAAEFSRVLSAARAAHVTLSISTGDQLRRELARMLGCPVLDLPRTPGPPTDEPGAGAATNGAGGESDHLEDEHTTADLATYIPVQFPAIDAPSLNAAEVTRAVPSDPGKLNRNGAEQMTHALPEAPGRFGRGRGSDAEPAVTATSGGKRKALLAAAIVAPLLVLGMVAGILYYVVPTATITLVPNERRIAADLTYGLAAPGANYDITIQPSPVSHTATFDKTIPTTGERFEPDGTASGEVLFTNPFTTPVTVPAHTELKGTNGVTYLTQQDVTVPGSDPFGALVFGTAPVKIVASQPGPVGNTDPGTVVGQLSLGVFYSNRSAVDGGTQKRIPVVTEADIAALKAAAEQDLQARAQKEFTDSIDPALKLVPNSIQQGDVALQFNHEAGQDAAEVSVTGTLEVRGQVFDPAKAREQARDEAGRRLAAMAGPREILLGDTLTIGDPTPLNAEGTAFKVHSEGAVRAVVTDEERADLASSLIGKDLAAARQEIDGLGNVASYDIKVSPDWLPARMPQIGSHITVDVTSEGADYAGP